MRAFFASVQRPADYDIEQADLEIRFGVGPWPGGNAAPLLLETLSPMCTARLLKTALERDWTQLPLIAVTGSRRGWSEWFALAGLPPPKRPTFRFDSFATALQAARGGAGVLLCSHALAHELISAGELVRLSSIELRMASAHWLVWRNERDLVPDVSRVWSWLLKEAATKPYAVAVDTDTQSRGSGLPMK